MGIEPIIGIGRLLQAFPPQNRACDFRRTRLKQFILKKERPVAIIYSMVLYIYIVSCGTPVTFFKIITYSQVGRLSA